jgi:hypothetical protein
LRSTQRSTVTRSVSGSIQTMWLPQPNAKKLRSDAAANCRRSVFSHHISP